MLNGRWFVNNHYAIRVTLQPKCNYAMKYLLLIMLPLALIQCPFNLCKCMLISVLE